MNFGGVKDDNQGNGHGPYVLAGAVRAAYRSGDLWQVVQVVQDVANQAQQASVAAPSDREGKQQADVCDDVWYSKEAREKRCSEEWLFVVAILSER